MKCPNCKNEVQPSQKFCVKCGTELNTKEVKQTSKGNRKPFKVPMVLVGLILAVIAVYFIAALFLSGGSSNHIVYGMREDENDGVYEALYSVDMNGKNNLEVYEEVPIDIHWYANILPCFTEDGSLLQFYDTNEEELVILNTNDGTFDSYPQEGDYITRSRFTDNGKYILANEVDGEELIFTILDSEGHVVDSFDDMTFISPMPNGKDILVFKWDLDEWDYAQIDEAGIINMNSGDYTFLASYDEDEGWGDVKAAKDGKTVFYQNRDELVSLDVSSGETDTIFETEEDSYLILDISDDSKTIAVIDYYDSQSLYTVDLRNEEQTRLDRYVISMLFTSDGKGIVYATDEGDEMYDLYYVKIDGSDKIRLAKDVNNLSYQLSPDGKSIAYLERSSYALSGDLMTMGLKEEIPMKLDTDVWSYQFTEDSRTIIYSKVEDLDRGKPESEIHRIGVNGRHDEILVEMDDGLYDILWPVSAYY